MRTTMLVTTVAMLTMLGLAGCADDAGAGDDLDTYVVGDMGVPAPFGLPATDDNGTADFFEATSMDANPGTIPADQFGGNQTGAEEAYGALLAHEDNDTRLIFWGAVRFTNTSAAEGFVQGIVDQQGCPSFVGTFLDRDVAVLVQKSSQGNATTAAADAIVADLETGRGLQRFC